MALKSLVDVIWEKCTEVEPFGNELRICLSIERSGNSLELCVSAEGKKACVGIVDSCVTLYTVAKVIDLEVCLSNIVWEGDRLKQVTITLQACAGVPPVRECRKIYQETVDVNLALLQLETASLPS